MLSSYLLSAILSLVSPSNEPQVRADVPVFGQRGQLVLHGSTSADLAGYHVQQSGPGGTVKSNSLAFSIQPRAAVFVVDNLLLGGLLNVQYQYMSQAYNLTAGIGPFIGYRVPMGTAMSFLPTVGAEYLFLRNHQNAVGTDSEVTVDGQRINVSLHADFVFHLAHRVSLTAGPFARQSVYNHTRGTKGPWVTTYGLQVGVLGWL